MIDIAELRNFGWSIINSKFIEGMDYSLGCELC